MTDRPAGHGQPDLLMSTMRASESRRIPPPARAEATVLLEQLMLEHIAAGRRGRWRPPMNKITSEHLARAAYVYVRQSTADQPLNNPESRPRQHALTERARELGWEDFIVIDDDLGRSGGGQRRPGLARMLAPRSRLCNWQANLLAWYRITPLSGYSVGSEYARPGDRLVRRCVRSAVTHWESCTGDCVGENSGPLSV